MRLIDTSTRRLAKSFKGDAKKPFELPEYGALSHCWGEDEDEVTFNDIQSSELPSHKKGFQKIAKCCEQAEKDGLKYIWVDTCCIDKSSSAELQEAISSMFKWYQDAHTCYVWLESMDVRSESGPLDKIQLDKWFTRGWTLQELLAPMQVKFFDRDWNELGTKISLKQHIHEATGISIELLEGKTTLQHHSIAERMSWAARRETKRIEDRAYSLFGIFQVNMPMLYGEGDRAFLRLQEEIIKYSDDQSIFAWKGVTDTHPGLLAPNLDAFRESGKFATVKVRKGRSSYTMTNRGIEITVGLTPWTLDTYLARIYCTEASETKPSTFSDKPTMALFLRRLAEDDQYARIKVDGQEFLEGPLVYSLLGGEQLSMNDGLDQSRQVHATARELSIHVRQADLPADQSDCFYERVNGWRICEDLLQRNSKNEALFSLKGQQWDATERMLTAFPGPKTNGTVGILIVPDQRNRIHSIKLGFDFDFNPVAFLAASDAIESIKTNPRPAVSRHRVQEEKHTPEEKQCGNLSLADRSPNDVYGWNKLEVWEGKTWACENHLRSGLWALKGDRIHGLDIYLPYTPPLRVLIKKVLVPKGLIWDLQLENWNKEATRPKASIWEWRTS